MYSQSLIIALSIFIFSQLTACQNYYLSQPNEPTEAALVANSYKNGLSAEIELDYLSVFQNLRQAYRRCIGFTRDDDLVFTENKLEEHIEMATLFARTERGEYVHKATVEKLSPTLTRFTLYLPQRYPFPNARFEQDIKRALGKDEYCNI